MRKSIYVLGLIGCFAAAFAASAQDKSPVVGGVILGVKVDVTSVATTGFRASKLMRSDVYNRLDEKVGKVSELIIAADGKVSLAIISVGGFLGIGAKNVAVPTQLFDVSKDGKVTLPEATKDRLKELPEFQYAK